MVTAATPTILRKKCTTYSTAHRDRAFIVCGAKIVQDSLPGIVKFAVNDDWLGASLTQARPVKPPQMFEIIKDIFAVIGFATVCCLVLLVLGMIATGMAQADRRFDR